MLNKYLVSRKSIWISIDATDPTRNSKGGEYKFHSILNNAPAYHNDKNDYLAYDGLRWLIMSESTFLDGVTGGWFKIETKGTLKKFCVVEDIFL